MFRHMFAFALSLVAATAFAPAAEDAVPKHLAEARALVKNLDLADTKYEHGPGEIVWDGKSKALCDCSGLLNHLLMHAYGWTDRDLEKWAGAKRPTAKRYHDAIADGKSKQFLRIEKLKDVKPGDILAVKYEETQSGNTGHIMLVDGSPQEIAAAMPEVKGAEKQWKVSIIDSSMSGHGTTDTRYEKGVTHTGVGRGSLRIFTDADGTIVAYTWSPDSAKTIYPQTTHHMVVGRLAKE